MDKKTKIQGWLVDDFGFILESIEVDTSMELSPNNVIEPFPIKPILVKPRWSDSKWIEGATQEENDEMTKVEPSPPTELELLQQENQLLKAQVNANASIINFHDEVLAEIILTIVP